MRSVTCTHPIAASQQLCVLDMALDQEFKHFLSPSVYENVHVLLLMKPAMVDRPLLARVGKLKLEVVQYRWNELIHLRHRNLSKSFVGHLRRTTARID